MSLADYFVRLRTTSIASDKYAETLDILYELFKNEQANLLKAQTNAQGSGGNSSLVPSYNNIEKASSKIDSSFSVTA